MTDPGPVWPEDLEPLSDERFRHEIAMVEITVALEDAAVSLGGAVAELTAAMGAFGRAMTESIQRELIQRRN